MTSNIRITKKCDFCSREFTAKTVTTQYCGDECSKRAYKARIREEKLLKAKHQAYKDRIAPIAELQVKEFLTVKEAAALISCSVRSLYYYIESGKIKAANPSSRMTRIRRSEIDRLFS
jgi:excisionase family DNA binding protein